MLTVAVVMFLLGVRLTGVSPRVAAWSPRLPAGIGRALGIEVSLCGDMGGDPRHLPMLLAAGLRSVSVAPPLVGRVKLALAGLSARAAA